MYHPCHSEDQCPPCPTLTDRMCVGNHELRKSVPCHVSQISCGKPCQRPLSCSAHTCPAKCHAGPCDGNYRRLAPVPPSTPTTLESVVRPVPERWDDDTSARSEAVATITDDKSDDHLVNASTAPAKPVQVSCGLTCNVLKPCGHGCTSVCHPAQSCPVSICTATVSASCKCGVRKGETQCSQGWLGFECIPS